MQPHPMDGDGARTHPARERVLRRVVRPFGRIVARLQVGVGQVDLERREQRIEEPPAWSCWILALTPKNAAGWLRASEALGAKNPQAGCG